jgi:hypothetical protein
MKRALVLGFIFFSLSQVMGQSLPKFHLSPNPALQKTQIEFSNIDVQNVRLDVFNLLGTRVQGMYVQTIKHENKMILHFPDLNDGIYLVHVTGDGIDMTQKLKIQR